MLKLIYEKQVTPKLSDSESAVGHIVCIFLWLDASAGRTYTE